MKKGVTVSMLAVAVAVMFIAATTASVVGIRSVNTAMFEDYKSKLRRLSDVVLEYIDENEVLPATNEVVAISSLEADFVTELTNNGDINNKLYVINLDVLDITSDMGKGTVENGDVFLVSENTNNVYYLKGKTYKGTTYYGL